MKNEVNRALVAKKKLTILFALLTLSAGMWAQTQTVSYRYPVYNNDDPTSGIKEWKTGEVEATEVTSSDTKVTWGTDGTTTWYVVKGADVKLSMGAVCMGNVHLILADGAKLTAKGEEGDFGMGPNGGEYGDPGIECVALTNENSLTIYGQSTNLDEMGQLEAIGGWLAAGIGGGERSIVNNNITINGGKITAISLASGAGIGGGQEGRGSNIFVNGGIVFAQGKGADGIGNGAGCNLSTNIFVATNLIIKADNNNPPTTVIENKGGDLAKSLRGKLVVTIEPSAEKITLTAADFTVTKDGDWTYDQTEKRVMVEISEEYIMPESSNIDIYYNNDKMVKPIEPGTYQVYIDIEETDTYAAVTGITSDAWKFSITDPLPAIKEAAIADINNVAAAAKEEIDGLGVDESAKSDAKAEIDNIVNTVKQTINAATSKDAIDNAKTQAIADIHNVVQTTKNMWVTLRTDVTANDWNTICMERTITDVDGATFWNVVSETDAAFTLEQVEVPFPAGYGYIIRYTATELKVKYEGDAVTNPVTATQDHPIQGIFEAITDCDQTTGENALTGNYVVYQNQLCKVTGWVTMADHRAYVVADLAPKQAPAPTGAPRMTMAKPNSTPTGLGQSAITNHKSAMKVIKDGQFVIIRDNKMYTIMGVEE